MAKRLSPALLAASILLFIYAGVGFWVGTSDREARWGLRAGDGRILLEPAYASVEALDAGLFLVERSGDGPRTGLVDATGRILLEPKYHRITAGPAPLLKVCEQEFRCGIARRDGTWVFPAQASEIELRGEGPYPFRRGAAPRTYGYVDAQGRILAEGRFGPGTPFREGLAWVEKDGARLLVNREFKVLGQAPNDIVRVGDFIGGSALACERTAKALGPGCASGRLINASGRTVSAPDANVLRSQLSNPSRHIAYYEFARDGRRGLLDNTGRVVLDAQYDGVTLAGNLYLRVKRGQSWGLLDMKGQVLLEPIYGELSMERDSSVVAFSQRGKWGLYSAAERRELVPARYDAIYPTQRAGRFIALDGDARLIIDPAGRPVVPQRFTDLTEIVGGFQYWTVTGTGVIDYDGKPLAEPQVGLGSYTIDYSYREVFGQSGARAFAQETTRSTWMRRASVLYANPFDGDSSRQRSVSGYWVAYGLCLACALLGLWLMAGATAPRGVRADCGRVLGFFGAVWIGWLALSQAAGVFDLGNSIVYPAFCLLVLALPATYMWLRRKAWAAPARWLSLALVWPGVVVGLMIGVDWLGVRVNEWMALGGTALVMAALVGTAGYSAWRARPA